MYNTRVDADLHRYGITHRSPPFVALAQSLSFLASSLSVVSPARTLASCPSKMLVASSFERVIFASRQLLGRRLPLCLIRRWAARIFPITRDKFDNPLGRWQEHIKGVGVHALSKKQGE